MITYNQYTLGTLLDEMKASAPERQLGLDSDFDSYRGYYEHVSFATNRYGCTAAELVESIEAGLGTVMTGYKGGEFPVTRECLVFIAGYGSTGPRLVGFDAEGQPICVEDRWGW